MNHHPTLALAAAICLVGCAPVLDEPGDPDAGSGPVADGGAEPDTGPSTDAAPDTDARPPWAPPSHLGQLFAGHYLGDYPIHALDADTLEPLGAPRSMSRPTGDVLAIPDHRALVVTYEGGESIAVFDSDSLEPMDGSPLATAFSPVTVAHDAETDRLYVYCIGTPGRPEESALTVYDTSTSPWAQIAGSPFAIDVPAHEVAVDPVTGRLIGRSLDVLWAGRVEDGRFAHAAGSPMEIAEDGQGSGLAIDVARRRIYFADRRYGDVQALHAFDLDSLEPVPGSPVTFAGRSAGEVVVDPVEGTIFVVSFGDHALHAFGAEPLRDLAACGSSCDLPPTETGLALDPVLHRLYVAHPHDVANPEAGPGFLTAWDVSDPAAPTEITNAGSRPRLGIFPNRLAIH